MPSRRSRVRRGPAIRIRAGTESDLVDRRGIPAHMATGAGLRVRCHPPPGAGGPARRLPGSIPLCRAGRGRSSQGVRRHVVMPRHGTDPDPIRAWRCRVQSSSNGGHLALIDRPLDAAIGAGTEVPSACDLPGVGTLQHGAPARGVRVKIDSIEKRSGAGLVFRTPLNRTSDQSLVFIQRVERDRVHPITCLGNRHRDEQ